MSTKYRVIYKANLKGLGDLGSFCLTSKTEGANTLENISVRNIKKISPRFMFDKEFKQVIDITEFRKKDE